MITQLKVDKSRQEDIYINKRGQGKLPTNILLSLTPMSVDYHNSRHYIMNGQCLRRSCLL